MVKTTRLYQNGLGSSPAGTTTPRGARGSVSTGRVTQRGSVSVGNFLGDNNSETKGKSPTKNANKQSPNAAGEITLPRGRLGSQKNRSAEHACKD